MKDALFYVIYLPLLVNNTDISFSLFVNLKRL